MDRGLRDAAEAGGARPRPRSRRGTSQILAFLENELGQAALKRNEHHARPTRRFEAAIELDARNAPAYLNLGDVRFQQGDAAAAIADWERLVDASPERAYLAFSRLEAAYAAKLGARRTRVPAPVPPADCGATRRTGARGWRSPGISRRTGAPHDALELLFEALVHNPHALALHQAIWQTLSRLQLAARARRPLRGAHARRDLLPRPAHLRALPLPQHGAALAVPALPRVEHVRRRAHRAGEGHRGDADELNGLA